ncbi:MAG: hypothetical protein WC619_02100 [Patescibacteria group bacterium]
MDKQILKTKLEQQAKNLAWRAITTVILTLTAVITVWAYAAFVEPTAGPNDSDQDFAQNILGNNDANNDFSSSNVVSNADGSIIERTEYLQQKFTEILPSKVFIHPLVENFAGYLHQDTSVAANNAITSTQIKEQTSRYPWAPAWTCRNSATGSPSCYVYISSAQQYGLYVYSGGVGSANIGAIYPITFARNGLSTFAPDQDVFVWEALVRANQYTDNGNTFGIFMGIANVDIAADWTASDLSGKSTANPARIGFTTNNSADKHLVGVSSNGSTIANTTSFDAVDLTLYHHYKFVYTVGVSVEFFFDGVSEGTISTSLPTSNDRTYIPIFQAKYISATVGIQNVSAVRCYFQSL